MLNLIFIAVGIVLNVICLWCIGLMQKKIKGVWKYFAGAIIGTVISCLHFSITYENLLMYSILGALTVEIIELFYLTVMQVYKKETVVSYYDDGTPPKFFITGDKHRDFSRVKAFCRDMNTRRKDVLIILGDAGFNYFDDKRDDQLKADISALNITLFCLHGNKENRPQNVGTYGIRSFCGGKVYYEPKYPNIYFAIDGETYNFEGKKYMVVGGAHSVDRIRCLKEDLPFWDDEMPDDEIKKRVEKRLSEENYKIYGMLTHTCPIDYLPIEMFMSTRQKAIIKRKPGKARSKKNFKTDIDRSTEIWLGNLEKKLNYKIWFCGHYHIDKKIDKIRMMHNDIRPLHMQQLGK